MSDGRKGYIARDFITQIDDVTNAKISAVANVNVNLRNGPGTSDTKVITTVTSGQSVTIIETGKYDGLDGYNWSRIKLGNGTQGYLVSNYLTEIAKTEYQIAYVNCSADGKVYVRSGVGTGNSVITSVRKDEKVSVIKKAAGTANGYTWDKIVTSEGLEGYIANSYLRYEESKPSEPKITENTGTYKMDGDKLLMVPSVKASDIKAKYPKAVIKNGDKALSDSDSIGTGNVITIDNKTYTATKLGDINGDGLIKSLDYMKVKNHIIGTNKLSGAYERAADVSGDGKISSLDYMKIKNHIMGTSKISL